MTKKTYAVVGVGNAIVDVIAQVDDDLITSAGLERGTMGLVDQPAMEELYGMFPPGTEVSGGSAANTIVGIASLGSKVAYIGKVRDDQLGEVFAHDLTAAGVDYHAVPAPEGPPTARCLVAVTPDAQRTMSTFLGISGELAKSDVNEAVIRDSNLLYCEGYLWDAPEAKEAIRYAMDIATESGGRSALTLSDPFCVGRHREEFLELIADRVDILFANEVEACSLYEVDTIEEAIERIQGACEIVCITRSEAGSVIVTADEIIHIPIEPVQDVIDTTGAGDMYAAGVLWGLANGYDLATCGKLGAMASAEVISHLGARPNVPLSELAKPILAGR